jgi:hypothetical protein
VAFHVEVRSSRRRARLFNLDADALRRDILAGWQAGTTVVVGEHRWDPGESSLRVLEGPRLATSDLAHGQGWNRAERSARDVTRELLGTPRHATATVVSATRAGHELGVAPLAEVGLAAVDWGPVRDALVAGADPGLDAALVMAGAETGPWLFDAGLVLGALGRRAVVVAAEPAAPAEIAGVAVVPADAGALAERLGVRRRPGAD